MSDLSQRCIDCERLFQKWYRSFMAQFKKTGNIIDKLPHEFCPAHSTPSKEAAEERAKGDAVIKFIETSITPSLEDAVEYGWEARKRWEEMG